MEREKRGTSLKKLDQPQCVESGHTSIARKLYETSLKKLEERDPAPCPTKDQNQFQYEYQQ